MKVLVTGASGFIGGNIISLFKKEGIDVLPLIRKGEYGDLRNYSSLRETTKNVDVVVNCAAALLHHHLNEKDFWDINVWGLKNLVNACIENKIKKLIHFSTVAVFGPTDKKGFDERAKIDFTDIYSQTKHEGDKIIRSVPSNLQSIIIRPTIAYGPGDTRPVIYRLFKMVKKHVGLTINGGENYIHTAYVGNIANAVYLAVRKDFHSGEDVIIGDEYCPKMREIIETISKVQNKKYLKVSVPLFPAKVVGKILGLEKTVKFVSENRRYKIEKAKKILGYNPETDLYQGMKSTYDWYRKKNLI